MASIATDKTTRRILFDAPDGKRQRSGWKVSASSRSGKSASNNCWPRTDRPRPEADTAGWLADLEPAMADKLARVGLIPSRKATRRRRWDRSLTAYIEGRADLKRRRRSFVGKRFEI
jgi:hypothetical protein